MLCSLVLTLAAAQAQPLAPRPRVDLEQRVETHLRALLPALSDEYGAFGTPQWVASLDLTTRRYPLSAPRAAAGQRVYRHIDAPFGSSLYWDLPQMEAAYRLAERGQAAALTGLVDSYLQDSLSRLMGDNGLLAWGNHYFYDFVRDEVVRFGYGSYTDPSPCPPSDRGYHELRPRFVPWDRLAALAPSLTEQMVQDLADAHLVGGWASATGAFDRHGNVRSASQAQYPFLEAGAVLIDALSWLDARRASQGWTEAGERADRIVQWVAASRDPVTRLLPNQQSTNRWDRWVSTSEVGLWALALLRAADRVPRYQAAWRAEAQAALGAWLDYAWDPVQERYYGKVQIQTGAPDLSTTTIYQPGAYSEAWNGFFPTHDYLVELGHACVSMAEWSSDPRFPLAIERIAQILREDRPSWQARDGQGLYAGTMGRAIQFLARAARVLDRPALREQAEDLAYEALLALGQGPILRTHAGENRYDAVDEVGFLLQAFLRLRELDGLADPEVLTRYSFGSSTFLTSPDFALPGFSAQPVLAGPGLALTSSTRGNPAPSLAANSPDVAAPSADAAFAAGDYYSFQWAAEPGSRIELSGVLLQLQRSAGADAATQYAVRSSLDGFATNLARDTLEDDQFQPLFLPLRGVSLADGQALELRIAFYGASGAGVKYARVDQVEVLGSVAGL